jgi:hypothetical protein
MPPSKSARRAVLISWETSTRSTAVETPVL